MFLTDLPVFEYHYLTSPIAPKDLRQRLLVDLPAVFVLPKPRANP
jgi:hypothetical protein